MAQSKFQLPIPTHNPSHSLTWLFHSRRPMPPWRCTPDPSCWVAQSVLRHHWSPRVARTTTSLSHPHSHRRHWCSSVRPLTVRRQCHRTRSCCCSHWEAPQSWCCSACWGKPGYWLGALSVPGLHASSMWMHWTCPCLRHQLSLLWCWCCGEKGREIDKERGREKGSGEQLIMFNIIIVIRQSNNNGKQSNKSVDLLTNSLTTYELGLCSHKYKRIYLNALINVLINYIY